MRGTQLLRLAATAFIWSSASATFAVRFSGLLHRRRDVLNSYGVLRKAFLPLLHLPQTPAHAFTDLVSLNQFQFFKSGTAEQHRYRQWSSQRSIGHPQQHLCGPDELVDQFSGGGRDFRRIRLPARRARHGASRSLLRSMACRCNLAAAMARSVVSNNNRALTPVQILGITGNCRACNRTITITP